MENRAASPLLHAPRYTSDLHSICLICASSFFATFPTPSISISRFLSTFSPFRVEFLKVCVLLQCASSSSSLMSASYSRTGSSIIPAVNSAFFPSLFSVVHIVPSAYLFHALISVFCTRDWYVLLVCPQVDVLFFFYLLLFCK